jgi:bifunctional pyridoxal-dependent enzyme with beta-cystathionase and maltose regulon repressor activities
MSCDIETPGLVRLNFGKPPALLTEGLERMRTVLGAR